MKTERQCCTVVLLSMTNEVHWSYFSLFAAKDGEDGNGFKLEISKFQPIPIQWPVFSSLETVSSEIHQNLNTNSSLCHKYLSYLVSWLPGMLYVWGQVLLNKFRFLLIFELKTANLAWQCPFKTDQRGYFYKGNISTETLRSLNNTVRRWLPLRLSKRQSMSSQTVLLRTTLTRTIVLYFMIWLLGSNHLQHCKAGNKGG